MRRSSEVLPVVRVDAEISLVLSVTVGTPDCLVVEHVKILVHCHFIQLADRQLMLRVGESTNVAILAQVQSVRIEGTKLSFVFFRMVKRLDASVTTYAVITLVTLLVTDLCLFAYL